MSERKDGGPAFPVIPPVDETGRSAVGYPYPMEGMTLLEWYAGQALPAVIAASSRGAHDPWAGGKPRDLPIDRALALDAFSMARAMLWAASEPVFTEADLFNCWVGGKSPTPEEAARFDWLEVGGVRDALADKDWTPEEREARGSHMEACDDADAEFWSVYGHYRPTESYVGVECITDGPPGDKARALAIAEHLGRLWNLPVKER